MALYMVNNMLAGTQQNMSSSYKTAVEIHATTGATTLRRGRIYEFSVGINSAPNATDCSIEWDASRSTAAGTSTAATPNPLDNQDAAALLTAGVNHTVEPTIASNTARLWTLGANQRASYRWVVDPGSYGCLIIPATNLGGIAFRALSATYASTFIIHTFFQE